MGAFRVEQIRMLGINPYLLWCSHNVLSKSLSSANISTYTPSKKKSTYIDQEIWSNSCSHASCFYSNFSFSFLFLVRVIPNALVPLEVWAIKHQHLSLSLSLPLTQTHTHTHMDVITYDLVLRYLAMQWEKSWLYQICMKGRLKWLVELMLLLLFLVCKYIYVN